MVAERCFRWYLSYKLAKFYEIHLWRLSRLIQQSETGGNYLFTYAGTKALQLILAKRNVMS